MISKFLVSATLLTALPLTALAGLSPMYNKYYSSDRFTFNGKNFENLSEEFAHAEYDAKDPDRKSLSNETASSKYRFDFNHEFVGSDQGKDRLSRWTETSSTGSGPTRVISSSTSTFYDNNKLRARTICASEGRDDSLHCATATQKTCVAILEKYEKVAGAQMGQNPLFTKDAAQNEKNMKSCQSLIEGYSDMAKAGEKYLRNERGYNDVVAGDTAALQSQAKKVFGTNWAMANITVQESKIDDVLKLSEAGSKNAAFIGSPAGMGLIFKLVETCRASLKDFDKDRLDGTAVRKSSEILNRDQKGAAGTR